MTLMICPNKNCPRKACCPSSKSHEKDRWCNKAWQACPRCVQHRK